jgi:ATP-dependent phosphoenolpyruvate carboxykinase
MPQGTDTHFSVLLPVVFGFQHGIGKNERGIREVYPVFGEVLAPFLFIPFKAYASILYKRIYDVKASSSRVVTHFRCPCKSLDLASH